MHKETRGTESEDFVPLLLSDKLRIEKQLTEIFGQEVEVLGFSKGRQDAK